MEPLAKASLNNQIVTMRHIVRKSKVHTINKLSREAKKLKEKKGSDEQVEKNKKKAERFVNELMVIKKLNDDAVTKYALQNEVPASKILNSVDITLETRARARLAGHKFITDAVQSFRNKYPDWKCSITDLLNDLGANYRGKKKKPNGKKTVKVKTDKKPKVLKNNDDSVTDIKQFNDIQSESESATESEGYETDSNKSEENVQSDEQIEKLLPSENNTSSEEDQSIELKPIIPNKAIEAKENKKSLSKCNTKAKSLQVDKLQEANDSDSEIPTLVNIQLTEKCQKSSINTSVDHSELELNRKPVKRKSDLNTSSRFDNKKKRNMTDEVTPICETVDSFFMTADDKDYMSVYKPPPFVEKDTEERPKLEFSKPIKKDIFIRGKKVVAGKQSHMGNRRERRQQQVEEPIDTVLHPSWEAKRKQKSLAKFEGKKITFDDED